MGRDAWHDLFYGYLKAQDVRADHPGGPECHGKGLTPEELSHMKPIPQDICDKLGQGIHPTALDRKRISCAVYRLHVAKIKKESER